MQNILYECQIKTNKQYNLKINKKFKKRNILTLLLITFQNQPVSILTRALEIVIDKCSIRDKFSSIEILQTR